MPWALFFLHVGSSGTIRYSVGSMIDRYVAKKHGLCTTHKRNKYLSLWLRLNFVRDTSSARVVKYSICLMKRLLLGGYKSFIGKQGHILQYVHFFYFLARLIMWCLYFSLPSLFRTHYVQACILPGTKKKEHSTAAGVDHIICFVLTHPAKAGPLQQKVPPFDRHSNPNTT